MRGERFARTSSAVNQRSKSGHSSRLIKGLLTFDTRRMAIISVITLCNRPQPTGIGLRCASISIESWVPLQAWILTEVFGVYP